MRDPRIGSFGAVAVAIAVLVEAAALGALASKGDALRGFVAAGALSRAAALPLACCLPYARSEAGAGGALSGRVRPAAAALGSALAVALAALLLGWDGLVPSGAVAVTTLALGLGCRAWLGGVTGDTLGAAVQLSEIVALVVLLSVR
jgi:adenosylcobinamide-GDP ribazoletransferase